MESSVCEKEVGKSADRIYVYICVCNVYICIYITTRVQHTHTQKNLQSTRKLQYNIFYDYRCKPGMVVLEPQYLGGVGRVRRIIVSLRLHSKFQASPG